MADYQRVQPLVEEQNGSLQKNRKRWTEALRPFNFDVEEVPLSIRIWQQFCLYVPAILFCAWCLALAFQLYWNPILCIVMCDIHLCWSIIEHGRFLIFCAVAYRRVLEGSRSTHGGSSQAGAATGSGEDDLHHAVFICAYKENIDVLRQTLLSIATQKGSSNGKSYASSHIGVNLCMEEREGELGEAMANELVNEFRTHFEWMDISYHPDKIQGEIQGKCSNLQWAVNEARSHLGPKSLVTCGDADSMFDPLYFSKVSEKFEELGDASANSIFQPTVMHLLNIFEQNDVVRGSSIFTTVIFAGSLEDTISTTLPYSTFTISADLMQRMGGWDVDYLNDDWHSGTKAFVCEPLLAQVVHMPYPVVNCAVEAESAWTSLVARWKQAKRHALGVEELVYLLQMAPVIHRRVSKAGGCCALIRIIAMNSIVMGVWIQHHYSMHNHFPLYGEAPRHFITSSPFKFNALLTLILLLVVLGKCFAAVRMVHHLVSVGRIGKSRELPWWARSPTFQYVHNFISMGFTLPVVAACGSMAEVLAVFKVAGWNKQSFEFYVAPKVSSADLTSLAA